MTDQTVHPPLTDQQLDEIEGRADAATPGPWERYAEYGSGFFANSTGEYLRGVGDFSFGDGAQADADEEFVKYAREDVDTLIAEVRRSRAQTSAVAAIEQVEQAFAAELNDDRALTLLEALIVLRLKLPCTCARSQGLHETGCRRYVPGHDLLSPARRLTRGREELCRPPAPAAAVVSSATESKAAQR